MKQSDIKAIIFDFDGVMFNSEPIHLEAYNIVFKPLGLTLSENLYFQKYVGLSDVELFPMVCNDHGIFLSKNEINRLIKNKVLVYKNIIQSQRLSAINGLNEFLSHFSKNCIFGICSGAAREEIDAVLLHLEEGKIKKHIQVVTSIEDVTEGKPSPEGYLLTARKMNVLPEYCLVIEDTKKGIQAAKNANMKVAALTTTCKRSDLDQADYMGDDFSELIELFL